MLNERQQTGQAARRLDSFIGTAPGTAAAREKQAEHDTPAPVEEGPAAPAGGFVPAAEIAATGDKQPRILTLYTHMGARRVPAASIRSVFPGGVPGDIYTYCVEVRPGMERMGNGEFHAHSVYGIRQSTAKWLCGELGILFVPGEEMVVRQAEHAVGPGAT